MFDRWMMNKYFTPYSLQALPQCSSSAIGRKPGRLEGFAIVRVRDGVLVVWRGEVSTYSHWWRWIARGGEECGCMDGFACVAWRVRVAW